MEPYIVLKVILPIFEELRGVLSRDPLWDDKNQFHFQHKYDELYHSIGSFINAVYDGSLNDSSLEVVMPKVKEAQHVLEKRKDEFSKFINEDRLSSMFRDEQLLLEKKYNNLPEWTEHEKIGYKFEKDLLESKKETYTENFYELFANVFENITLLCPRKKTNGLFLSVSEFIYTEKLFKLKEDAPTNEKISTKAIYSFLTLQNLNLFTYAYRKKGTVQKVLKLLSNSFTENKTYKEKWERKIFNSLDINYEEATKDGVVHTSSMQMKTLKNFKELLESFKGLLD